MSRLQPHRRHAFTLLEVLLALGLTVIVMALVGTALTTTLKLVESGRVRTERDQLARAILSKIADDVRSSVRYEPFDASGMMKINTSSSSSSGSQSGQSSTSTSGTGNSSSSGKSSSSGNSGANSSTSGTASSQSSNSSGGSSSNTSSSNSSSSSSDQSSSSSTPAVVSTTITGLVGDDSGLQIDLGRIPRLDEYVAAQSQSSAPVTDVRRVMYYLANSASSIVSTSGAGSSATSGTGLIRSEANHATAQYTADTGGDSTSTANGSVVAPEVLALEFSYFDGSEWVSAWDTTTYNGLPQLIKISIALADPAHTKQGETPSFSSIADAADKDPDNVYSVVVRLPASDPIPSASGSGSSSSSASSSSSGSTNSSGTSASTGGGSTSAN